jgi:DNA-binding transcriptional LysR family regulator
MQQYDLIALHSFIAVVDTGSFYQAAERLDASSAAISRRVSGLEGALGVRLLNRTTRKIELTEAGQHFYNDINNVLNSLNEAENRIQQGREVIKGTIRLAAPLSFGIHSLSPVLPAFMQRHPELKVQLQLDDRRTDLISENIDLALRIGHLKDSSLVATKIATIPRYFCASPNYLTTHGEPTKPEQATR